MLIYDKIFVDRYKQNNYFKSFVHLLQIKMSPDKSKNDNDLSSPIPLNLASFSKGDLASAFQSLDGSVKELKSVVIDCTSQMKTANNKLSNQLEISKKNKIFGECIEGSLINIVEKENKNKEVQKNQILKNYYLLNAKMILKNTFQFPNMMNS